MPLFPVPALEKHAQRAHVVYGYPLLFRSGPEYRYDALQADVASASTVDSILLYGTERLAPGAGA